MHMGEAQRDLRNTWRTSAEHAAAAAALHCGQEQACTNNNSSTSASVVIEQACRVRGGVLAKQAHSNSSSVLAE